MDITKISIFDANVNERKPLKAQLDHALSIA
jgi:hypothetical protein